MYKQITKLILSKDILLNQYSLKKLNTHKDKDYKKQQRLPLINNIANHKKAEKLKLEITYLIDQVQIKKENLF